MSYSVMPLDPSRPHWSMSLGEFLAQAASTNPEKVYLYYYNQRVTYRQLVENSLKAARLFRELGIARGDRVGLFLKNCPEFLYCWFGLSTLGAIAVPINTAYKAEEGSYIVNQMGAKALLTNIDFAGVVETLNDRCHQLETVLVLGEGDRPAKWQDFSTLLDSTEPLDAIPQIDPTEVSTLIFTSGTSGAPKGVMVTHEMYVAAGQGFATWTEATPQDRFFTCLPFFHANAHYYSTMGSLAARASLIIFERFSASRFWSQVSQTQATIVNFIGMMLPVLMKQGRSKAEHDHCARLFYGSPAFPAETLTEFENRFHTRVLIGFAMTEACYGTIEPMGGQRRAGSCGTPRWHPDPRFHNKVRVADENGNTLPPGVAGEIAIRNPAVTPGYWGDKIRTEQAIRDGWLYTGDMAWTDEDGYFYFVDRKKDIIRRRGENISSREIEELLKQHPKVSDCAVFAVPSELGEDEIKAVIVAQPREDVTPEELIGWCAQRLAYFKVPRYVEFRSDLPRTPSLRVRKDLLRQEMDAMKGCFDREKAGIKIR